MFFKEFIKTCCKAKTHARMASTEITQKRHIEFTRRNELENQIYFDKKFSLIAPRDHFPYAGNYNCLTIEQQLNELESGLLKNTGTIGPVTTSLLSMKTITTPNQTKIRELNEWLKTKQFANKKQRTVYSGQPICKVINMIHSIEKGTPDFRGTFVGDKQTAERYADKTCLILAFSINPSLLYYNILGYGEIKSCNAATQLLKIIGVGTQKKRASSMIRDGGIFE